ncbi:MAG: trigger factor [Bdellovibrionales bacterium]|nr:trigger factor [Bdellovibrionales bacterium]
MKSTVDKLEGLSRKINVQIPAEKVQQAFDKVYKAIQKKANIKGFRQGKAPIATIKSMYAEQVKSDVMNDLINESYQNALDEHKLEPVGYPKVSFEPIMENKDFGFTAEFEVRPEVQLKKYDGLPVMKEKLEIPNDRVESILENIRSGQAELVPVFEDRGLEKGDVAEVDFDGFVNGQPLPNGSAKGHQLEIGTNQFIEGFEDGLLGMRIGDNRTLNLKFPDPYHEPTLSGAPVTFQTKLSGMKKKRLPELNDDLAKKVGDFQSLDDLKARIRKDIEESETKRIQEDVKNRIVRALVEANPVEAPRSLVEQQKQSLEEDFKGRLKQQGMADGDFEEYKKKWGGEFEQSATFMVKSTFLLDTLADKLGLRATKAEVDAKIVEYSQQTGIEMARLNEFYGKPERRSRLMFQVTEEKVVNYLMDKATVTEVAKEKLENEKDI